MKTPSKILKLSVYHWRHCAVVDLDNNCKRVFEVAEPFGADHVAAMRGKKRVSPKEQCIKWLADHGYEPCTDVLWTKR